MKSVAKQTSKLPWEAIFTRMVEVAALGGPANQNPGLMFPAPDVMKAYTSGSKVGVNKKVPVGTTAFRFRAKGMEDVDVFVLWRLCFTSAAAVNQFQRAWDAAEPGLTLATLASIVESVCIPYGVAPVPDLPMAISAARLKRDPRPPATQVFVNQRVADDSAPGAGVGTAVSSSSS